MTYTVGGSQWDNSEVGQRVAVKEKLSDMDCRGGPQCVADSTVVTHAVDEALSDFAICDIVREEMASVESKRSLSKQFCKCIASGKPIA